MQKLALSVLFAIVVSSAFGENWNGATTWKDSPNKMTLVGGYEEGYFDTVLDKLVWSDQDRKAWSMISIQVVTMWDFRDVDRFYQDPANLNVSPARAMRLCLEAAIAKTPDGPRLLAVLGVKPQLALR